MPKISELNAITVVANNDLLMVIHDPAGLPSTNKITVNNFVTSVSSQLRGYTGSLGSGYVGSAGNLGYAGSAGVSGYAGSAGSPGYSGSSGMNGYTGSSGVPGGGTTGQILVANASGYANWQYSPDVRAVGAVYLSTNYTASANDTVLLVVPATQAAAITITLPGNVPPGKVYTIRNIDSGNGQYPVIVNNTGVTGLIEDPHLGTYANSYYIQYTGDTESWIYDGNYYRSMGGLSNSPVFLTSANSFHQVVLKNTSIANNASGDYVVYNDAGDYQNGIGPFIDMGINSSNYTDTTFGNVWGPSDAYLYNTGGDLVIGPQNDYSIKLIAGNTNNENIRLVVNSTSVFVNNTLTIVNSVPGASPEISSIHSDTNLVITVNDKKFKLSTNGSITFPDNTVQNTAYAGGATGYSGSKGDIGYSGSKGDQGITGFTGSLGNTGFVGSSGTNGTNGYTGSEGIQGSTGFVGSSGTNGTSGYTGSEGIQGSTGFVGSQGNNGYTGSKGPTGSFGGAAFNYNYSTNTTHVSTPDGFLNFNNTNLSTVSSLYIDYIDALGANSFSFLQTIDDSTSSIKGHFSIKDVANSLNYAMFSITGAHSQETDHFNVPVSYLSGVTSFADGTNTVITFARTGDIGDTGYTGSIGGVGYSGSQGNIGYSGSKGDIGNTGYDGSQGTIGNTGYTGSEGAPGTAGSTGYTGSTGSQGVLGYTGSEGTTGSSGSPGFTGSQGTLGYTGSEGSQGTLGYTGSIGYSGSTGITGFTGSSGVGYDGSAGAMGSIGYTGSAGLSDPVENLTINGILSLNKGVNELFVTLADATGIITHDCANGHIFYHTSPDANFTANVINLSLQNNYATTITLVISQGATGYYANALHIEGNSQTINWQGNLTPSASSNRKDILSFNILNSSGSYIVLGQLTGY